jgi:hypothetical protein
VGRYERWAAQHPDDDTTQPSPGPSSNAHPGNVNPKRGETSRRQDDSSYARAQDDRDRGRQAEALRRDEQNRLEEQRRADALKEEARRKAQEETDRRQREDIDRRRRETARREEEQRQRGGNDPDSRRKEDVVANARRAAGVAQHEPIYRNAPQNDPSGPSSAINIDAQRRQQEFEQQQAEMKKREEEIIRARRQNDIARRQDEADDAAAAAARAARQNPAQTPSSSHLPAPRGMGPSRIPSFSDSQLGNDMPLPMPLESPTRHDDDYSTDRESVTDDQAPWHRDRNPPAGTPTKTPIRGYVIRLFDVSLIPSTDLRFSDVRILHP